MFKYVALTLWIALMIFIIYIIPRIRMYYIIKRLGKHSPPLWCPRTNADCTYPKFRNDVGCGYCGQPNTLHIPIQDNNPEAPNKFAESKADFFPL